MELLHHAFARTLYRFLLICFMFVMAGVASAATMYLPATSTTGNFTISWTSGMNAIKVYENTATGGVLLGQAGPNSSYNVTGKTNGTYAYYLVECVYNGPSAPICTQSNFATITVTLPSQNPAPAAPASVSASASGSTASISWPAVSAATYYPVLRNGVMLNSNVGATSYTDSGLAPGPYTYQVQACNANGCSGTTASNAITITLPIPAAPASVSASSGIGYATASWAAVSGATRYEVQRAFSQTAPTSITATSYTDYAVSAGSSYSYDVRACNGSGCSAFTRSNAVTVAPPVPTTPTGISAAPSGGAMSISWNATSGASSYTIQKIVGGSATEIANITATSYSDASVTAATTYTYSVKACNVSGCSSFSAGATASTPVARPAAPGSVSAVSGTGGGYAYVSWPTVSGATYYSVQRAFSMTAPVTTTASNYADSSVTVGNSYSYDVSACNSSGCSTMTRSNAVTIAAPLPSTPTGLSAAGSAGAVSLSWSAASGASSYTLQKNAGGVVTEITGITATSYSDASVTAATTYTYSVKACNGSGCSAFSAGATATTPVAVPAAPASATASSGSGGGFAYVSWSPVGGATSYRVQQQFSMTAPVSTTATNYADTAVTVGNSYSYLVQACNASGCSAAVTTNAVTIAPTVPVTPTGFSASPSGSVIYMGWTGSAGATSYTIQKTVGATVTEFNVGSTTYSDAGVSPGTTYSYRVKACNVSGCSAFSAAASATANVAVPAAPATATATSGTGGGFAYVSWTAVGGATSYSVQRVASMTAPISTTATNYADSTVTVGNSYSYQVKACNTSGCSAAVTTNSVTIAPTVPVTPTGFSASPSGSVIYMGWTGSAGATSYTIQKTVGATVTEFNVGSTTYSDAGVIAGTTYSYRVKACNVSGCSAFTAAASATANVAVPAAPATATATSGTGGGFAYVSWTAVGGATSYSVQRVASMTAPISTTATNYADSTVTVGNSYSYQVKACNTSGCSAAVTTNSVTIAPTVPAVPTGVAATASGSAISVSWTASASATTYTIQKTVGVTVTEIPGVSGTVYSDTSVIGGTAYSYSVKACNVSGCSAMSTAASATANAAIPVAPATATAVSGTGGGFAYVSWTAVTGATSYSVQRVASQTAPISTGATNYADTTVTVGGSYSYQVKACNTSGCSAAVTTNSVTIAARAPATPTGLFGTPGDTSIVLGWTAVSGATSYSVQRTPTSASFPVNSIATTGYTDAGLAAATLYSYNVRACNSSGCSAWSAAVTVTTRPLAIPVQPASLSVAQVAATVRLSWTLVPNATSYKLKRTNGLTVTVLPDAISTSATDASVAVDVAYIYQVQACNSAGCSPWTSSASIQVPHIPAPPSAVSAVVRQNVIFVTWTNNDNATSAKLSRNGSQLSAAASSPHTDAGVIANTVYTYGVSACNATGCSAVVSSPAVTAGVMQAGVKSVDGYVYDVLGRLNKVKEDGSLKTQYDYDKAGNRKQVNE